MFGFRMKGLDLSNKQRILFALFCFALLGITYITLLPHPKLTTDVKRILNVPLQELRNGTSLKTCKHLRRAKGMSFITVYDKKKYITYCVKTDLR